MDRHPTVLLVEDNEAILTANRDFLQMHGYRVLCAATLAEAGALLSDGPPDLVVLDILLPDGSGFDFCAALRAEGNVPILFLTALGEKSDLIKGLRLGGDDYLTKPYDLGELLARIEALLRRAGLARGGGRSLTLGPLTLDFGKQRAYGHGADLLLQPKEFLVLRALAERPGVPLRSGELYDLVWGAQRPHDDTPLWVAISGIRKKLAMAGCDAVVIRQKRGAGYTLTYEP